MSKKIDLDIILPIKSALAKDFDDYFSKAIESIKQQKSEFNELIIVHTQEETLLKKLNEHDFGEIKVKLIPFSEAPDYCKQMNAGIEASTSEWISFFEFDDEYSTIWFDNVGKYIEGKKNVDGFLPIVVDTDNKGMFAGFTNEAVFAASQPTEMGYLTNELLLKYQNFQTSGMVIKRESVELAGKFKPSMKLTFSYEFLLRLTYNSAKILTIPKLGYKHNNLREGSIFWNYKYGKSPLSPDEVKFWLDSAKKEYFFTNDREIKYEAVE